MRDIILAAFLQLGGVEIITFYYLMSANVPGPYWAIYMYSLFNPHSNPNEVSAIIVFIL